MPSHPNPPSGADDALNERRVLEEEFIQLHGPLCPTYVALREKLISPGADDVKVAPARAEEILLRQLRVSIHALSAPTEADKTKEHPPFRIGRSALCLSGGGIRSATFSLGVLQGLAGHGLLGHFHFLSTVSGGGYLGSWLTAWIHRHPRGLDGVCGQLGCLPRTTQPKAGRTTAAAPDAAKCDAPTENTTTPPKEHPAVDADRELGVSSEPRTVGYLRRYSNYLTPRLGITSGDTWALAAIYVRNLLLNWMVLLPLIAAVLLIPRLFATMATQVGDSSWRYAGLRGDDGSTPMLGWIQLATLILSLLPLTMIVLCLPSVRRGIRERGSTGRPEGEDTVGIATDGKPVAYRTVFVTILLPLLLACGLSTLDYAWRVYSAVNSDNSPRDPGAWRRVWISPVLYVSAATIGAAWLAYKRRPNTLKFFVGLATCYAAMGLLAALLVRGLQLVLGGDTLLRNVRAFVTFYPPGLLAIYLLTLTLFVGLTSRRVAPEDEDDREWLARLQGNVMFVAVGWIALASLALWGPMIVHQTFSPATRGYGVAVVAVSILSVVVALVGGRSESSGAHEGSRREGWRAGLLDGVPDVAARVALLAVFLVLACAVNDMLVQSTLRWRDRWGAVGQIASVKANGSVSNPEKNRSNGLRCMDCAQVNLPVTLVPSRLPTDRYEWPGSSWSCVRRLGYVLGGLLTWVMGLGLCMNFNRLSLHSTYRNRLVRAYLGASNPDRHATGDGETTPRTGRTDPYTGFDPKDNVPMHHLRRPGCFRDADLNVQGASGRPIWHEVAEFWLDDDHEDSGFRKYAWYQMPPEDRQAVKDEIRVDADGHRPNPKPCAAVVRLRIVHHLNLLLDDTNLVAHSRFRYLVGIGPRPATRPPPEDLDVERAFYHRHTDGCSTLLNWLILEAECTRPAAAANRSAAGDGRTEPAPGEEGERDHPLERLGRAQRPFHVVNLALNLVAGRNLAWQQRKAASFTVTPLHCGFYRGYRSTVDYGGGITLGTAMTISGAAATPNMGYHSSPAVTFLMTLFNARLGWWLGSPAQLRSGTFWDGVGRSVDRLTLREPTDRASRPELDGQTYHLSSPRHSLRPLLDEALGRTNDDNEYVYLSDGGHFENLGLYEMVRRRCRCIVVVDATFDPRQELEDLGNAIRKVRIDLGVPITFERIPMEAREGDPPEERFCAVGTIVYSAVDAGPATDGVLIYLKPPRGVSTSVDVYHYGRSRGLFPHESTTNQWFSESQFESYRRLGQEVVDRICSREQKDGVPSGGSLTLEEFVAAARGRRTRGL